MIAPTENIELLRVHRASAGLRHDELAAIARQTEVVRLAEGEIPHDAAGGTTDLLLVIAGRLSVVLMAPGGVEKTVLFLGRDDQFGLLAMAQDDPFPLRLIAQQPTVLLRIPRAAAIDLLEQYPVWSRHLMRTLAPALRNSLLGTKQDNRPRFVLFLHASEHSRHLASTLSEQLHHLGERIGLLSDDEGALATEPDWSASLLDERGQLVSSEEVRRKIGGWSAADRVFLDCHVDTASGHLGHLLTVCEAAYWFCDTGATSRVVAELRDALRAAPGLREKIFVVRVLDENEPVARLEPGLADVCQRDFKIHWNGRGADSPMCSQRAGLDRLLHHLRGVSIGLALGGGAARGMAHLGVLQVFDEAGITIDRMSGTSAGALTGILYAAGFSADFLIEAFARDLKPGRMYRMMPWGDLFYMLFKYRRGGWDEMLRKYIREWQLEQLPVPFSSVAVDLVSAEAVVRDRGDAVDALLESINLPGLGRPICRDGRALVDGGVLNVVPADVLVDQGANFVIASDVASRISFDFAGNTAGTPTEQMQVPGTMATIARTRTVQDRNICSIGGTAADIVLQPDVSGVQLSDFKRAAQTALLGRVAAEEALPRLRSVLNELDPQLFRV